MVSIAALAVVWGPRKGPTRPREDHQRLHLECLEGQLRHLLCVFAVQFLHIRSRTLLSKATMSVPRGWSSWCGLFCLFVRSPASTHLSRVWWSTVELVIHMPTIAHLNYWPDSLWKATAYFSTPVARFSCWPCLVAGGDSAKQGGGEGPEEGRSFISKFKGDQG